MRWLNLSRLRYLVKTAGLFIWMYIAAGIGLCRWRTRFIVERHTGERSLAGAKRVAIFVHYDRRGQLHDYALYYLNCLRGAGFEVLFVSNAPLLAPDTLDKLRPLCALILRRKNIGYDFGAYKDAIGALGEVAALDELLITNDSVYGPFTDLNTIIARCELERAAVWGITDSWFRRYHLQSYFLLFKQPALAGAAFTRFWRSVRYVQSKRWIIEKYEIGLSRAMIGGGLRCAALYPYRRAAEAVSAAVADLRDDAGGDHRSANAAWTAHQRFAVNFLSGAVEAGLPLNSTHHMWDYLITAMACPFLKRELLERNPMDVPALQRWETLLRNTFDYDTDLILRHLEARARNRAV